MLSARSGNMSVAVSGTVPERLPWLIVGGELTAVSPGIVS